jgi:hypothetical protein
VPYAANLRSTGPSWTQADGFCAVGAIPIRHRVRAVSISVTPPPPAERDHAHADGPANRYDPLSDPKADQSI